MPEPGFEQTDDSKRMSESEWLAWYQTELRKGWQDDICIPGFRFDQERVDD